MEQTIGRAKQGAYIDLLPAGSLFVADGVHPGPDPVGIEVPERASAAWWLQRPLWVLLPALCILPLVGVFRRFEGRRPEPAIRVGRPRPQGR